MAKKMNPFAKGNTFMKEMKETKKMEKSEKYTNSKASKTDKKLDKKVDAFKKKIGKGK